MNIEILMHGVHAHSANNGMELEVGAQYEVSEHDGKTLVSLGVAKEVVRRGRPPKAVDDGQAAD